MIRRPNIGPIAQRAAKLSRRQMLTAATAFGMSALAARRSFGQTAQAQTAQAGVSPARAGGTLTIAMRVPPIGDPRLFEWPEMGNIARQVIEPLVRLAADGALEPCLLESWQMSPDAREATLYLRRGVTWSNGDAFSARDVLHNLRRWCDSTVPGNSMADRCAALIDPVTGQLGAGAAEIVDDHSIALRLYRGDATLMASLADYPALIVHRDFDAAGADLAAAPVGTGPFTLIALEPGIAARVDRREGWWGGTATLESVVWRDLGTSPAAITEAFAAGTIDLNHETPADAVAGLDALGLTRHALITANTVVARMRADTPPYDDPTLRRAVGQAVDNGVVLALGYAGRGIVADDSHVGPMHPDGAALPGLKPDPAAARRRLAELRLTGYPFELVSIDDDWRRNTADAIAVQMRDAGFALQRRLVSPADYWAAWREYPFSTTNWSMRPFGVQTLALAYRSNAAWNETGLADPAFDATLDAALAIADPVARRVPMLTLQRRLRDSGVIIQPYWREVFAHASPRVHGFTLHPAFEQHLDGVWVEEDG